MRSWRRYDDPLGMTFEGRKVRGPSLLGCAEPALERVHLSGHCLECLAESPLNLARGYGALTSSRQPVRESVRVLRGLYALERDRNLASFR